MFLAISDPIGTIPTPCSFYERRITACSAFKRHRVPWNNPIVVVQQPDDQNNQHNTQPPWRKNHGLPNFQTKTGFLSRRRRARCRIRRPFPRAQVSSQRASVSVVRTAAECLSQNQCHRVPEAKAPLEAEGRDKPDAAGARLHPVREHRHHHGSLRRRGQRLESRMTRLPSRQTQNK